MSRLRLRDRFLRWLEAGRVHRPVRWQDWPVSELGQREQNALDALVEDSAT